MCTLEMQGLDDVCDMVQVSASGTGVHPTHSSAGAVLPAETAAVGTCALRHQT